jgi:hypothetical protein
MLKTTRAQRKRLETENRKQPLKMTEIPRVLWPACPPGKAPYRVWRSRDFLAQLYSYWDGLDADDVERFRGFRLTVSSTHLKAACHWADGLTWDNLQEVKRQCGMGHWWAVEIYPPDDRIVNDANMRHLWLLHPSRLPDWIGWKRSDTDDQEPEPRPSNAGANADADLIAAALGKSPVHRTTP